MPKFNNTATVLRMTFQAAAFAVVLAVPVLIHDPALAASLPADCSKGSALPGDAKGEIANKEFAPQNITLRNSGSMEVGADKLDSYMLKFSQPESGYHEMLIDMTVLVHAGQQIDGHKFRATPGGINAQPKVAEGLPEVQGWSAEDDEADVHMSSVFSELSSLQVTFGQRKGNVISGTIYLCAPSDQSAWVSGHFMATIDD